MRAVILAGGRGTRLKPFTASFPKPLVPLGDTPVIDLLIRSLVRSGISDITLTLGHLSELIQAYFAQRQPFLNGAKLSFAVEREPTGTAGSLASVDGLDETFLVANGDLLTNLDFQELVSFHRRHGAALTIATHRRTVKIDLGVLEYDADSRVTNYIEKPHHAYDVSMGVYVYEPSVLRYISQGKYLDFPELVLRLLADGQAVCAYPTECLWLDIGRPDDYARAQELFDERRNEFEVVA